MGCLEGKRALVGGGSRGLGRACAEEFARLGAAVTLVARDEQALREAAGRLPAPAKGKGSHGWLQADFRDPDALARSVRRHVEETGPFQILLNNTGGPPPGPILEAEPERFREFFSQHVVCFQLLTREIVPGMRATGYGRILNIVSTSVREPIPTLGVSNTIRAAVAGWAKTLARELAPSGITVNNILPGATRTERLADLLRQQARRAGIPEAEAERGWLAAIPMGRFGEPSEIAAAAGFLASPAAAYITGVSLPVDGGRIASI